MAGTEQEAVARAWIRMKRIWCGELEMEARRGMDVIASVDSSSWPIIASPPFAGPAASPPRYRHGLFKFQITKGGLRSAGGRRRSRRGSSGGCRVFASGVGRQHQHNRVILAGSNNTPESSGVRRARVRWRRFGIGGDGRRCNSPN